MLVHEAINQFLADLAVEGRSKHTVAAYQRDLTTFNSFTGDLDVDAATPELLTRFMASDSVRVGPCGTRRGKATINRYRVSLKALFAWCEARWLVTRNPTGILRCRRHQGPPPIILTEAEVEAILDFKFEGISAARDRALLVLMLSTGCRLAETVALDVRDIIWDTGRITLCSAKGGEPEQVAGSGAVLEVLSPIADRTDPGQALFRTSTGRRLSARQVQRIVARRCAEAGITKPVTPHTLRHTFATRLYNRTRDIRLVQQALRHGFITTTQRYVQVDPERLAAAVEFRSPAN